MTHLWPSSVWTRDLSTLKPDLEPAAWDWSWPRHKSCGSGQDNSWPRWILMRCHYWLRESMSSMLREISVSSLSASCRCQHRFHPAPAAASTCSMPVWGRRQNPDPGFHQYSAGLLQLAILWHSRWFDEPPAVSSECCRTSHHRSQAVRAHHASPTSAPLAASLSIVRWLAPLLCT